MPNFRGDPQLGIRHCHAPRNNPAPETFFEATCAPRVYKCQIILGKRQFPACCETPACSRTESGFLGEDKETPQAAKPTEGERDCRRHRWGMLPDARASAPGRLGRLPRMLAALGTTLHPCRVTLVPASPEEQKHACTNRAHACADTHTCASLEDGEGARIPPGLLAGTGGVTSQK